MQKSLQKFSAIQIFANLMKECLTIESFSQLSQAESFIRVCQKPDFDFQPIWAGLWNFSIWRRKFHVPKKFVICTFIIRVSLQFNCEN